MLKQFALPEVWDARWNARSVALELFTLISAPVAIGYAIITAVFVRVGDWPIISSDLIGFLCLIYAFCALGFPILPLNQKGGWKESILQSIWIVIPGLAAIVVWVMRFLNKPELDVHLLLIIISMCLGVAVQRNLSSVSSSVLPPLWIRRMDGIRLGILTAVISGAAMFYVLLRLFTDRESFMTQRCEDLVKGDFVVLHLKMDGNGQIPPEQIGSCNLSLNMEMVYQNKRFIVYQIQR
jgi:hypothetical protein